MKKNLLWISLVLVTVGVIVILTTVVFSNKRSSGSYDSPKEDLSYPHSGKGIATMENPIRAYLDPLKTYTRILGVGNAKYVLESDPSRFFICNEKPGTESGHIQEWYIMPAGNYLIYPEGIHKIAFEWY